LDKRKNVIGTFIVLNDITSLEEVMKSFEKAKIAAESANKAKSEFLATMSHEIRTPINGIIGMAEFLKSASLTSEERESLDTMEYSADLLLTIINDILDFSKIEAGRMKLESTSFNLRELVANTVKTFDYNKKQADIALALNIGENIPELLLGDYVRVRQILVNLLSNAFKFTERGEITVQAYIINSWQNEVLIEFAVSDTGIGIPGNKINNLFQSFHQLDGSTTRKYGGTGLGLSIVKSLVELMGGSIQVISEKGKGSTFSFQIPFKIVGNSVSNEVSAENDLKECNRVLRILVAEDSKVSQMVILQYIKKRNWEAVIVENGKEVLKCLEEDNNYDLIFMDIQMPEMDGYEAAKLIRESEKNSGRHIPIIALTANATEDDRIKCLECGMDDFLPKPVRGEKFYSCVLRYLG
jgi:CheY-like chemotaxis protein